MSNCELCGDEISEDGGLCGYCEDNIGNDEGGQHRCEACGAAGFFEEVEEGMLRCECGHEIPNPELQEQVTVAQK